jgi:hypothetical protein
MDTKDIDRSELERRLMWLLKAVWRQMSDSNCIEASFTLHGALKELGVRSEVQPVAAFTEDRINERNAFLGRAGYEYYRKEVAAGGHSMPDYIPVPDAPDFFVDGGHVVVLVPDLEFLMDATLDQIPGFPLKHIIGPADKLSHDEPAMFGTDDAWVAYLLVDDVIDLKPAHRELIMGSGAELARKGLEVDFSREAFIPGTKLFNRVVD